jgi:hypothetical protein
VWEGGEGIVEQTIPSSLDRPFNRPFIRSFIHSFIHSFMVFMHPLDRTRCLLACTYVGGVSGGEMRS